MKDYQESVEYEISQKDQLISELQKKIQQRDARIDLLVDLFRQEVDSTRHSEINFYDKDHHSYIPLDREKSEYLAEQSQRCFEALPKWKQESLNKIFDIGND